MIIAILIQKIVAPKLVKKLPEGRSGIFKAKTYKAEHSTAPF